MLLNLVTAFQAEADPFIQHYDLQSESQSGLFPVFRNSHCALVISGSGKTAAAAATAYLYKHCGERSNQLWINIGIAGHQHYPLGSVVVAHKIIDQANGQCWYPPQTVKHRLPTADLYTVDRPETDYPLPALYDMEASGFYTVAAKCTTRELAQVCKIVSDNTASPAGPISKDFLKLATHLIEQSATTVIDHIEKLRAAANTIDIIDPALSQQFMQRWHFTVSRQHQLRKTLQRLRTLNPRLVISPDQFPSCNNAEKVLQELNALIDRYSATVFCDD